VYLRINALTLGLLVADISHQASQEMFNDPSPRRSVSLDAHHRLAIAALLAVAALIALGNHVGPASQIIVAWDVFAAVDLALAWRMILRADPTHLRETTKLQDASRSALFGLVLLAACAAFASVAFVLGPSKGTAGTSLGLHLALSAVAVVGAWLVVHTAFALRYAHLYYTKPDGIAGQGFRKGLEFPGTAKPDYMDFAYFSFVIGMTSQVSDVQITSPPLRRLALVHGVLSFFFNVVILGLTISVMSGLL
jgi:uncharacterized membrane protein